MNLKYFAPINSHNNFKLNTLKSKVIVVLKKLKIIKRPNLFDDKEFLHYVYKKKKGLENNVENIETLALRGSNADYGFYSPLWKNSYNLGLTSSNLYTIYHIYNNYRGELKNLKNVIIFFSVSAPGFSLIKTSERYRAVSYQYYFNIPYPINHNIESKYKIRIIKKCVKLKRPYIENDYSGYDKKEYYGTHILAKDRVKTHIRENKREPDQMQWLESLYRLIDNDKRRLIIVIPPFRDDYKKLLPDKEILFKKLFRIKGLNILDYYDSKMFTNDDHGDTDHLNEKGAIKLTKEIKKVFEKNNWI